MYNLFIFLWFIFVSPNIVAAPIEFKKYESILSSNNKKAWVTTITKSPDVVMKVVYLPDLVNKNNKLSGLMTLVNSPQFKIKHDRIVVNGGYASDDLLTPLGLLISDGIVKSTVLKRKSSNTPSCGKKDYTLSGIVCQNPETKFLDLMHVSKYSPGICKEAIQAGPFIIEPDGAFGICKTELNKPEYKRTVICQDSENNTKFIHTEAVHLYDLGKWLSRSIKDGGLGCTVALLLASDESAAMIYAGAKETKPGKYGRVQGDQISAIFVHTKSQKSNK